MHCGVIRGNARFDADLSLDGLVHVGKVYALESALTYWRSATVLFRASCLDSSSIVPDVHALVGREIATVRNVASLHMELVRVSAQIEAIPVPCDFFASNELRLVV